MIAAWRNERLSFKGRYFSFDDIEVLPKPLQQPHPPTWVAAVDRRSREVGRIRRVGHSILMSPHPTHAEIGAAVEFVSRTTCAHWSFD